MADLIDRQAAVQIAKEECDNGTYNDIPWKIEDLPSVNPQDCDTCEVGNPCLYCKHEFEPQESEGAE